MRELYVKSNQIGSLECEVTPIYAAKQAFGLRNTCTALQKMQQTVSLVCSLKSSARCRWRSWRLAGGPTRGH